ncbi:MAG: zinc ribbon domain-containing protein [Terracidiphilus sp.]
MASVCGKCGAIVSADKQFCTACGASSAAISAPVTSVPTVAPPARSGSGALKIILIVVAIFLGLGVIGAGAFGYMFWRVSRGIHVSGSGDQVTMTTPGGSFSANSSLTYSASDLGTEIYPGAESGKGGMKMNLPGASMLTAVYLTTDSKGRVLDFYKEKLGDAASVFESGDGAVLTLNKGQRESVVVTITAKPSQNDGKTQIAIVHMKPTKPS